MNSNIAVEGCFNNISNFSNTRLLDFLKENHIIFNYLIEKDRIGIQPKDEPEFLFLDKN